MGIVVFLILGQVGIDHTSPPQKIHPVKDRMFCNFFALHLRVMYEKGHLRRRLITLGWSNVARLIGNIWKHHLQTFSFSAMFGHQRVIHLDFGWKNHCYTALLWKSWCLPETSSNLSASRLQCRVYVATAPYIPTSLVNEFSLPPQISGEFNFRKPSPYGDADRGITFIYPSQCDYRL